MSDTAATTPAPTVAPTTPTKAPCFRCDHCKNVLCRKDDIISEVAATFSDQVYTYDLELLGQESEYPVYSATNPSAVRFDVARVSAKCHGDWLIACATKSFSEQHSWFPPYAWCMASCASCGQHLGWGFADVDEAATAEAIKAFEGARLQQLRQLKEQHDAKMAVEAITRVAAAAASTCEEADKATTTATTAQKRSRSPSADGHRSDAVVGASPALSPAAAVVVEEGEATAKSVAMQQHVDPNASVNEQVGSDDADSDDSDDDRFETAQSHSEGDDDVDSLVGEEGEEMEVEVGGDDEFEDFDDDDEEGESDDGTPSPSPARTEEAILSTIADTALHPFYKALPAALKGRYPPHLRPSKGFVYNPLAFIGLIVTRCDADEDAPADVVAENVAAAPRRAADNLLYQTQRRELFGLLNDVPMQLRALANQIGMNAYTVHNNFITRREFHRVMDQARQLAEAARDIREAVAMGYVLGPNGRPISGPPTSTTTAAAAPATGGAATTAPPPPATAVDEGAAQHDDRPADARNSDGEEEVEEMSITMEEGDGAEEEGEAEEHPDADEEDDDDSALLATSEEEASPAPSTMAADTADASHQHE